MKMIDGWSQFVFIVNCSLAVAGFVYAMSGSTWFHIMWAALSGINVGAVLLTVFRLDD